MVGCAAGLWMSRFSRDRRASSRAHPVDESGKAPLGRAYALLERDDPSAAIELLDDIDTRTLDGKALSQWLNLKASALALLQRSDEALELLDDLESIADAQDLGMKLCLVGNRGLAHLMAGRLELAAQLLDDTEALAHSLAEGNPRFASESVAETWFWRATIAERQANPARRRECLEKAAAQGDTAYAVKAQAALQKL